MSASRNARALVAAALAGTLAACGGSPNTPNGSTVNSPGGPPVGPQHAVNVGVVVSVPLETAPARARYVSPKTESVTVALATSNGGPVSGLSASTIDTRPNDPNCTKSGEALVCTGTVAAVGGNDIFNVTSFAWPNGTGAVLSAGSVDADISANGGAVSISTRTLSVLGVVASLKLAISPASVHVGRSADAEVTLSAYDAAGASIAGESAYQTPVTISIEGDAVGAYSLRTPNQTGTSVVVSKPDTPVVLAYDGNTQATSIALAATIAGGSTGSPTASATFTLTGVPPPPKGGDIYVLDAGANDGLAATVTVYDANANGNAAPKRTLELDRHLYARSLALDPSGDLFVGYYDSPLGENPATGAPDAGNLIDEYAAGASGSAAPIAQILFDTASQTAIFPSNVAFDPQGDPVTFGATALHSASAAQNAVLTYAAGVKGAQAPAHAFSFSAPFLLYPGTTGLAVDRSGNFYVNGTFKLEPTDAYGLYAAPAADRDNPAVAATRVIPWDATTQLTPGQVTTVGLDEAGAVYIASFTTVRNAPPCTPTVNVYASGFDQGTTDGPPLRSAAIPSLATSNAQCNSGGVLSPFFGSATVFGSYVYVSSDFGNAVALYRIGASGTVTPAQTIAGAATGLDAPIAIAVAPAKSAAVSTMSGRAAARPAATLVHSRASKG